MKRWVDNVRVTVRVISLLPGFKKYVDAIQQKRIPKPQIKSFRVVAEAMNEPEVITARLHFFVFMCEMAQAFLTGFQSDAPLVPFLYGELIKLLSQLMPCFMKDSSIPSSGNKIVTVNFDDKETWKPLKKVNI